MSRSPSNTFLTGAPVDDSGPPFPQWLKDELSKPGRSQSALARHMGLDPSAVNRLVNGARELKYREMERISEYLHATGGTDEKGATRLPVRAIADIALVSDGENKLIDDHYQRLRIFTLVSYLLRESLEVAVSHGLQNSKWTLRSLSEYTPRQDSYDKKLLTWALILDQITEEHAEFVDVALDVASAATAVFDSRPVIASMTPPGPTNWADPPGPFPDGLLGGRLVSALRRLGRSESPEQPDRNGFDVAYVAAASLVCLQLRSGDNSVSDGLASEFVKGAARAE